MKSTRAMMAGFYETPDHVIASIAYRCESILWRVYRATKANALSRGRGMAYATFHAGREVGRATERLTVAMQTRDVPGAEVIAMAAKAKFFENCQMWQIAGK